MLLRKYDHDCEHCVWVGWSEHPNGLANMYHCDQTSGERGVLVIRWGDDPSQYEALPLTDGKTPSEETPTGY